MIIVPSFASMELAREPVLHFLVAASILACISWGFFFSSSSISWHLLLSKALIIWEILPRLAVAGYLARSRCYGQIIVNCTLLLYDENTSPSRGKFDLPWLGEVMNPFVDRLSTCRSQESLFWPSIEIFLALSQFQYKCLSRPS